MAIRFLDPLLIETPANTGSGPIANTLACFHLINRTKGRTTFLTKFGVLFHIFKAVVHIVRSASRIKSLKRGSRVV